MISAKLLIPTGLLAILMCVAADVPKGPAGSPAAGMSLYPGNTVPSDRVGHSLKGSDIVMEVPVKHGQRVKKGELLLKLDNREEALNLKIIQLEAQAEIAIEAAKVTQANKLVELERVKKMGAAAAVQELSKAELEVELAKLDVQKATMEHHQRVLQAQRQEVTVSRMEIRSSIDGIVQEMAVKVGEVLDPTKPAIVVVKNDPLWVNVYLPTKTALALKKMQEEEGKAPLKLKVVYPDSNDSQMGTVIFFDPVADAGADMQLVRLELPNADSKKPAGLQVQVEVPTVKDTGSVTAKD